MTYLARIDGLTIDADKVGKPMRGGESGRIKGNVWVFTDGLVVTPASAFDPNKPIRPLQRLDLDTLEPDLISAAYGNAVRLDRDGVARITLRGRGSFLNPYVAFFQFSDESAFWRCDDENVFRLEMPRHLADGTVSRTARDLPRPRRRSPGPRMTHLELTDAERDLILAGLFEFTITHADDVDQREQAKRLAASLAATPRRCSSPPRNRSRGGCRMNLDYRAGVWVAV